MDGWCSCYGTFFRCYECVILPWFAKRQMADTALKTTEMIVVFCGWSMHFTGIFLSLPGTEISSNENILKADRLLLKHKSINWFYSPVSRIKCWQFRFLQTTDRFTLFVSYFYKMWQIIFRLHVYYLNVISGDSGCVIDKKPLTAV